MKKQNRDAATREDAVKIKNATQAMEVVASLPITTTISD